MVCLEFLGSKNDIPPTDDNQKWDEDNATLVEPQEKKLRDLSNRSEHYNTMHADKTSLPKKRCVKYKKNNPILS